VDELKLRKEFLNGEAIQTIYFGGGTPSVLEYEQIMRILEQIYVNFDVVEKPEITFEANPDDLSDIFLRELLKTGINRLSIGVQSFFNDDLKLMHRIHSADEARNAILKSQSSGFNNLNIDLIYGLPGLSLKKWSDNLEQAFKLNIQHLSLYHLTVEPHTVYSHWLKKGRIVLPEEDESIAQFKLLREQIRNEGFIPYEISNFAKEPFFSRHNLTYWQGGKYLGVGPSAHSYNGIKRTWNIANNRKYAEALFNNHILSEEEILDEKTRYNDFVMTSLRTIWGIDRNELNRFSDDTLKIFEEASAPLFRRELIENKNNSVVLTEKGILLADMVIAELFNI
jgi:oxygen-independent coproporphyrinogen-3 oxidase